MAQASTTTDHDTIRRWAEERNGRPACVKGTQRSDTCLLRIDFEPPDERLEEMSWDDFFDTFDKSELVFLYQDQTASGRKSRFNKFVSRDAVDPDRNEGGSGRDTARRSEMDGGDGGMEPRSMSPSDVMDEDEDEDEDVIGDDDEEEDDDAQRRRRN